MFTVEPFPTEEINKSAQEWQDWDADVIQGEESPGVPMRHTATEERDALTKREYVSLERNVDGARIEKIMVLLLGRAGISKAELARRMKVNRASLQPYYRGSRKNGVSIKFLIKMLSATGARLLIELPKKS